MQETINILKDDSKKFENTAKTTIQTGLEKDLEELSKWRQAVQSAKKANDNLLGLIKNSLTFVKDKLNSMVKKVMPKKCKFSPVITEIKNTEKETKKLQEAVIKLHSEVLYQNIYLRNLKQHLENLEREKLKKEEVIDLSEVLTEAKNEVFRKEDAMTHIAVAIISFKTYVTCISLLTFYQVLVGIFKRI